MYNCIYVIRFCVLDEKNAKNDLKANATAPGDCWEGGLSIANTEYFVLETRKYSVHNDISVP